MKKLGYVEPTSYFPKTNNKKTKTQSKPEVKKPAKKK